MLSRFSTALARALTSPVQPAASPTSGTVGLPFAARALTSPVQPSRRNRAIPMDRGLAVR